MSAGLPLLLAGPVLAAGVVALLSSRLLRQVVSAVSVTAVLTFALALVWTTKDGVVVVEQVAGWPSGVSITYAADLLSALMLTLTAVLVLCCLAFAAAHGDDADRLFLPLVLTLSGGVFGALVTADLFNLFVCIEVALIPSYVLMTRSADRLAVGSARLYLTVNLLGSTTYLLGVGLLYGVAGTVNVGQLAGVAHTSGEAMLAVSIVLVALAVKAAVVPVHGWLPRTYPAPSPAVTALFSGLLTKVGVYALFRVYSVTLGGDDPWSILLIVAVVSMVVGVLGALGETTMRGILAFHMVSQVGYVLVGLSLGTVAGVAAAVFYLLTYSVVKTSLFLTAGAVESVAGTGRLTELGGLVRRRPLYGIAFLASALSLIGIPPFVGFIAKYGLVAASVDDQQYVAAAAAVGVSFFTLLSMMKVWNGVFWGEQSGEPRTEHEPLSAGLGLVIPGLVLATAALVIGLFPEPLLSLADQAARGLVDPTVYVTAVSSGEGT
jgi:multicomponent Na+:H+ antiporter subunit D